MTADSSVGLFGKLPGYGDFLRHNLSNDLIQPWDEWLQAFVSVSREQVGANWLDIYLTSPIWRFALSRNIINDHGWAGVVMPSVDRVGRYFPFSVLMPLTDSESAVNFLISRQQWFHELESLCLQALQETIDVEYLIAQIGQLPDSNQSGYLPTSHYGEAGGFITELPADDNNAVSHCLPFLFDACLSASQGNYSLWQTAGSDLIAPSLFCTGGLPPVRNLSAMIDGQWQSRDWKIPFNLNV